MRTLHYVPTVGRLYNERFNIQSTLVSHIMNQAGYIHQPWRSLTLTRIMYDGTHSHRQPGVLNTPGHTRPDVLSQITRPLRPGTVTFIPAHIVCLFTHVTHVTDVHDTSSQYIHSFSPSSYMSCTSSNTVFVEQWTELVIISTARESNPPEDGQTLAATNTLLREQQKAAVCAMMQLRL